MSSCCCRIARLILVALLSMAIPTPAAAQHGWELGIQGIGTFADFDFAGGGLWGGWRPGGRTRFGISLMPGAVDGEFAGRGELVGHFLLNPSSRRSGLYAGGGLAALAGERDDGYVLLVLGFESRPGGGSGWVIETGIGGGVRVLVGLRWRRLRL